MPSEDETLPKVLCVDDEPRVLEGLENALGWEFDVQTAVGGAEGLALLETHGPFAVVLSDMRMPQMNGAEFLSRVRVAAPDTTRILLTGYAELEAAQAAINQGAVFRFLQKPCGPEDLMGAVTDGIHQHKLLRSERELLERTLHGAIELLIEVLSVTSPLAFNRATVVKQYMAHMATVMGLDDPWKYEVAAMLARIGCIALPADTLEKAFTGQRLAIDEQEQFDGHPAIGQALVRKVPRLEIVAAMIARQTKEPPPLVVPPRTPVSTAALGGAMLRFVLEVDDLVSEGKSVAVALGMLKTRGRAHPPMFFDALGGFSLTVGGEDLQMVTVAELQSKMVLDEDVRTENGAVVITRGSPLSPAVIQRLRNFDRRGGIKQPFRVRVPL